MHTSFFHDGDGDDKNGTQAGSGAGDYTPPEDLPIPGESEAVPNKDQ